MATSNPRRVVITGLGLISPLGNSPEALWENLRQGKSGVCELRSLPTTHLPSPFGAEAWDFSGEIDDFGPLEKQMKRTIKKGLKVMCREIQMGVAAAQLTLTHAGLAEESSRDPNRTGVVYGSDYIMTMPEEFTDGIRNCLDESQNFHLEDWAEKGIPKVDPLWLLKYLPNMPASHIAIYNDLRGPNNSITLREASANLAVGEAYCTIARGSADMIVAGATGTRVHPLRTVHVALQQELASDGEDAAKLSRPFDRDRTGMVLGEGAAAIVLEELSSAERRGATIYGEVVGHGSSTVLDRDGRAHCDAALRNVLAQTLRSSELAPEDIGHLHAHGLATRQSDRDESRGIQQVFGQRKDAVPVVAAKSYFGNLGAGGGIVELIASVLAMHHGELFPTLNFETPDPDCPLNVIHENASRDPGDSFINMNVTPQGQASAVAVRRFQA